MSISLRLSCAAMAACLVMLAGCRAATLARYDGPAVLVDPDASVIAQLHHAVSTALGGRKVMLARDALTRTNLLVIEPSIHRTLMGRLGSGRNKGRPEEFHLVLRHSSCILLQDGSNFSAELKGATCQPFNPRP